MTRPMLPRRDGFVLLAVLWAVVGVAALGLAFAVTGREAVAEARNRVDITRAAWRAEGCAEEARALIGGALAAEPANGVAREWNQLDRLFPDATAIDRGCQVALRPVGARLNVNTATAPVLRSLFAQADLRPGEVDSLVDALLDWRDGDDEARPDGAERSWYLDHGRTPPRNGPLADLRELRWVRGYQDAPGLMRWLDVEPGRVSLDHAPAAVLGALPGIDVEAVETMLRRRAEKGSVGELQTLAGALSPASQDTLAAHYAELAPRVTLEPDAWILTARAGEGTPAVVSVVELRLERAGNRAAVVRRRTWTQ